jgi:hypothetical protein
MCPQKDQRIMKIQYINKMELFVKNKIMSFAKNGWNLGIMLSKISQIQTNIEYFSLLQNLDLKNEKDMKVQGALFGRGRGLVR